jgi:hypothetical protein
VVDEEGTEENFLLQHDYLLKRYRPFGLKSTKIKPFGPAVSPHGHLVHSRRAQSMIEERRNAAALDVEYSQAHGATNRQDEAKRATAANGIGHGRSQCQRSTNRTWPRRPESDRRDVAGQAFVDATEPTADEK